MLAKIASKYTELKPHTKKLEILQRPGDSRNKTRPAKVMVVAHNVVKYTTKIFGYDYTLYCVLCELCELCYRLQ